MSNSRADVAGGSARHAKRVDRCTSTGNRLDAAIGEAVGSSTASYLSDGEEQEANRYTASIPVVEESNGDGANGAAMVEAEATERIIDIKRENALQLYLRRLRGAGQPGPRWFAPTKDAVPTLLFPIMTLMILSSIHAYGLTPHGLGLGSYLPSFGASCALAMLLTTTPGAQPRAIILTHLLGAFLGISWSHITHSLPMPLSQVLASAFAVSILTSLMMLTGSLQPSASATTSLAAYHLYGEMKDQGFMFLITPALLGACIIVVCAWIMNNLTPWRPPYPVWL